MFQGGDQGGHDDPLPSHQGLGAGPMRGRRHEDSAARGLGVSLQGREGSHLGQLPSSRKPKYRLQAGSGEVGAQESGKSTYTIETRLIPFTNIYFPFYAC